MTYYKYKERDATSQVNWADVSKKFSDEIGKIGKERDTKREAIDKATDDLVTKINEAPMGQHKNANLFTSQLVDQATQDTLRMNNLLKSGDIRPSEYMNYIENQKSSVTGLYDMVTGYQDVYTDKMTRMQNGQSLPFEWEGMAAVEGFGNFANTTPVLDQYGNYTMVNDVTGQTMSVAEMNAITKQYFNAYDIDGAMQKHKEQLGQYLTVEMKGNTKTIDDVRNQAGFIEYMDNLVAETLAGPLATSTVLLKDLPGYSTSFSPGDDPNKVLTSVLDPRQPGSGAQVPLVEVVEQVEKMTDDQRREIFSEDADVNALISIAKEQRKAAEDWAKTDLNFRLDRIETARQEFAPSTRSGLSATERGKYAETESGLESLAKVFYGDKKLRQEGLDEVFGQDETITSYGVREGANGQQEIFVQQMRDDGTVWQRTPIPLGDAFTQFAKPAGTQFFDAAYIDDVLPGILKKYEGRTRGSGEYTTTRQPIVTDLGSVEITYRNEKQTVRKLLNNLDADQKLEVDPGVEAAENADLIRSILGSQEIGIDATVTGVSENQIPESTFSGIQIYIPNRMDKPIVVPNRKRHLNALPALLQEITSNQRIKAEDLLKILPQDDVLTASNTPEVISSIFTEEVTEEAPDYNWATAGK